MPCWTRYLTRVAISGTTASLTTSIGLAIAARCEGKSPWQPLNATAHWHHGDAAATITHPDLPHTGIGYATNHAATLFWAAFYEAWLARAGKPLSTFGLLWRAAVVSAFAVVADYRATPKRFTPGWELVLTKPGMTGAYIAMALGLAAGARLTHARTADITVDAE